ncbi:MAG TPA: YrdB family protein [Streptosporangiaceae bacterium]
MTSENENLPPGPASPSPLRATVLAVRFATELALLAALVVVGVNASTGLAGRIALAVLGPVVAGVIWAIGIAPRAQRRWPDPWRMAAEVVLFLAAAAGLAAEGSVVAAAIFAVVTIGTALLTRIASPGG